ncbi:MAG: cobalamin-dependent protein [Sedimentisphaerales bacterium]|nr:cobalamin-dependent protein [Sedimentisphaerales bacterium]
MDFKDIVAKYLEKLLEGDRMACRKVLGEALQTGTPATGIYTDLFWPVMVAVENLYRSNKIDLITEHMATRINRTLVDQLQNKLPRQQSREKIIVITCNKGEPEELGAQMCADLFESEGWTVKFLGGGVPNDEIISLTNAVNADILFIYGTKPSGAPDVRRLIDDLREIKANPQLKIMLSGGVFNRAEGLAEEMGADFFAPTAKDALKIVFSSKKGVAAENEKKNRSRLPEISISRLQELIIEKG